MQEVLFKVHYRTHIGIFDQTFALTYDTRATTDNTCTRLSLQRPRLRTPYMPFGSRLRGCLTVAALRTPHKLAIQSCGRGASVHRQVEHVTACAHLLHTASLRCSGSDCSDWFPTLSIIYVSYVSRATHSCCEVRYVTIAH